MNGVKLTIRPINKNDFSAWKRLYQHYLEFYKTELSEEQLTTLWSWFFDPSKEMHCYLATHEDQIIGLVHFREYLRPIKATTAIFIDDLYVDNQHRGMGIARQLIQSVNDFSLTKNITLIRWATAHDNHTAMKLYDKIATQTQWKIYDMQVS